MFLAYNLLKHESYRNCLTKRKEERKESDIENFDIQILAICLP